MIAFRVDTHSMQLMISKSFLMMQIRIDQAVNDVMTYILLLIEIYKQTFISYKKYLLRVNIHLIAVEDIVYILDKYHDPASI